MLLMERWRDGMHYFSVPGGGIEAGETPEQTVTREIIEETTVEVTPKRLIILARDGDREHRIYLCDYKSGEPVLPVASPEALDKDPRNQFRPTWIPQNDWKELPLLYWEPLRAAITDGLQNGFPEQPIELTM